MLLPCAGCVTLVRSCHFVCETASVNHQTPSKPQCPLLFFITVGPPRLQRLWSCWPLWGCGNISPVTPSWESEVFMLLSQAFPGNCWPEALPFPPPKLLHPQSQGEPGLRAVWSPVSSGGCLPGSPVPVILLGTAPGSLLLRSSSDGRGSETAAFLRSISTFPVMSPCREGSS